MKRFGVLVSAVVLILGFAGTAGAFHVPIPWASSFDFLVDSSGSMMEEHKTLNENKMVLAKAILLKINDRVPIWRFPYKGAVHSFSPDSEIVPFQHYNEEAFAAGIKTLRSDLPVFGRLTALGDSIARRIQTFHVEIHSASPRTIILITDGESNQGQDPVEAVRKAYEQDLNLCFHAISLADSEEGQKTIDAIIALRPECGATSATAAALLANDAAIDKFADNIFCNNYSSISIRHQIQFDLDSAAVTEEGASLLDDMAVIFKEYNLEVKLYGFTCSIGSPYSNQLLSERRAEAVKQYLVEKGVPAGNITTIGYGDSQPLYDNSSDAGRRLNRRVDVFFSVREWLFSEPADQ